MIMSQVMKGKISTDKLHEEFVFPKFTVCTIVCLP